MNLALNTHLFTPLYLRHTLIANNQLIGGMERVISVTTLANATATPSDRSTEWTDAVLIFIKSLKACICFLCVLGQLCEKPNIRIRGSVGFPSGSLALGKENIVERWHTACSAGEGGGQSKVSPSIPLALKHKIWNIFLLCWGSRYWYIFHPFWHSTVTAWQVRVHIYWPRI